MLREILLPLLEQETRAFVPKLIDAGIIKSELLTAHGPNYFRDEVGKMLNARAAATDSTAPYLLRRFACMKTAPNTILTTY